MFSCGGRADGGGQVASSQVFPFAGGAGPLAITPRDETGSCFAVNGAVVDIAACNEADPNQAFTIGGGSGAVPETPEAPAAPPAPAPAPIEQDIPSINPTTPVPVARAGGVLDPAAAAESHERDNTATRAFSSVSLRTASGECLFIDPTAGDFRQNLIPIAVQPCTGSPNEKFDIITAGEHNNAQNAALVVSALTQGCLNFDERRAPGDTAILFSCGGRADGDGLVTDSQLFEFTAGEQSLRLQPQNGQGTVCLVPNGDNLDPAACNDADASQIFTIV